MMRIFVLFFSILFFAASPLSAQESLRPLYEKGITAFRDGNYDQAIESLEEVIKQNPNFAPGYNALGLAYRMTGASFKEVAWYFKAAVDIDPTNVEALDNLGKAYYGMGEYERAEDYCQKALAINPEHTSAQFSLAWIYLLGKVRPHEAAYYFKRIITKTKNPSAYFGLGVASFMLDDKSTSLEMITLLRGADQEQLAEQLENIVRDYYYVSEGENKGMLAKVAAPIDVVLPSQVPPVMENSQSQQSTASVTGQVEGVTKVRMRGSLYSLNDENKVRITAKGASSSSQIVSDQTAGSKGSTVTQVSTSSLPNQDGSGEKRMIEVQGEGY